MMDAQGALRVIEEVNGGRSVSTYFWKEALAVLRSAVEERDRLATAATRVAETAKDNPLTSDMQEAVSDLRAALAYRAAQAKKEGK